jgi:hypothetical protein
MARLPTGAVSRVTARYCKAGEGAAPGWGHSRRRSPLGLVRPDRDRQARRSYAEAVNEMSAAGPGAYLAVGSPPIRAPAPSLQGDPEEPPHLRRQIEGAPVAAFPRSGPARR